MPLARTRRNEGACAGCALRKRKCDLKKPSCSQCKKRNLECEPRTFRHYSSPNRTPRSTRGTPPRLVVGRTQSSRRRSSQSSGISTSLSYSSDLGEFNILDSVAPLECDSGHLPEPEPEPEPQPEPELEPELPPLPSSDTACSPDDSQQSSCVGAQDVIEASSHNSNDLPVHQLTLEINTTDRLRVTTSLCSLPFHFDDHSQQSFLWSYFVFRGSKIFLCWDTEKMGSDVSIHDPYTTALTAVAAHSRPLYLAALALSAFLHSLDYPGVLPSVDVTWFRRQTLSVLKNTGLGSTEISVDIVLARLIMFLLDMNDGRASLEHGSRVKAPLYRRPPISGQCDSLYTDVALHLLRWTYICKHVSFSNEPDEPMDDPEWRALEFRDEELETPLGRQFSNWVIHPLYTVSHRWINPLLKLGRLVCLRRHAHKFSHVALPEDFEYQVDQLEEEILAARGQDLLVLLHGSGDLADLLYLNEAIHSAILLTFYTRLRDIAWTSSFVRQQAKNVCEYAEAIGKGSRTLNNVVFPIFLAGCEAVDEEIRNRITSLLSGLHPWGFWFRQEFRLLASLQHVWVIRDEMPGASWPEWSQRVLLDNAFCIPV